MPLPCCLLCLQGTDEGGHSTYLEVLVRGALITLFKSVFATNHSFHGAGTVMATKSVSENKMSLLHFSCNDTGKLFSFLT